MSELASPAEERMDNITATGEAMGLKPEQAVMRRVPSQQVGEYGVELRNMGDLWRFAEIYLASGLAPKDMKSAATIAIAVQLGLEVGLHPAQAVQSIAVINGRPAIWGDPQLGLVRRSGLLEEFEEWYEHKGQRVTRWPATPDDSTTAICRVKRVGYPAAEQAFSVLDAKIAKLWGREGPWQTYPSRMLKMRPRGFVLRDQFGDVLKGLRQAEEVGDYIEVEQVKEEPIATPLRAAPGTEPSLGASDIPVHEIDADSREFLGINKEETDKERIARYIRGRKPFTYEKDGTLVLLSGSEDRLHAAECVCRKCEEEEKPTAGPPVVQVLSAKKWKTVEDKTYHKIRTSDGLEYVSDDLKIVAKAAQAQLVNAKVQIVAEPGPELPRILEIVAAKA